MVKPHGNPLLSLWKPQRPDTVKRLALTFSIVTYAFPSLARVIP